MPGGCANGVGFAQQRNGDSGRLTESPFLFLEAHPILRNSDSKADLWCTTIIFPSFGALLTQNNLCSLDELCLLGHNRVSVESYSGI